MGKSIFVASLFLSALAHAQTGSPNCLTTAVPPLIRAEGVAERLGDIVLKCSGTPNLEISGNLTVFLNAPITNRILSGSSLDAVLTVNNALSPTPAQLQTNNSLVFPGLRFTLSSDGAAEVRISNLRADATALGTGEVIANLAFNPPSLLNFTSTRFSVGVINRGLFASTLQTVVASQIGSPVPANITFNDLLAEGTRFSTTRVTEGFVSAFERRGPNMDQGNRVLIRLSGFPSDARLFVPNAIAGSNALKPTRAGDFGGPVSGGEYQPGSGTLLLVRIAGHDANGGGGSPAFTPSSSATTVLNDAAELPLVNGAATAVYEVYDSNVATLESAQIPIFLGLPRTVEPRTLTTVRDVFFGPISDAPGVSANARIPRFAAINAPSDCTLLRDCDGPYLPKLKVISDPLEFVAISGAAFQIRYILIENTGGGILPWNARVEYRSGRDWIRIGPSSATNGGTLRLDVLPMGLAPGDYEATLFIDAGNAGSAQLPVRLRVSPLPPPLPIVSSAVNAASFAAPIVPGSLATLKGTNLGGANPVVTISGRPARVLFVSNEQINFEVPADLTGVTAPVVVTAGGLTSAAFTAQIAAVSPGIFVPGILNQDNTVNSATNPAKTGSFVQIFLTGLTTPAGGGMVEVKLHDAFLPSFAYAGPAPGIPGVQQVNIQIPETYPTMTTDVLVCSSAGGQRACSPSVKISMRQ